MQLKRSKYRLDRIIFLRSPQLQTLASLPEAYTTMYSRVSTLPPHDPESFQLPLPDPGKRPWETSKTGYLNWAVGQLLVRGGGASGKGSSTVGKAAESAYDVGKSEDVKAALVAAGGKDIVSRWESTRNERGQEDAMEL
jgi:kinetochore protein Mis12/MTW1